MESKGHDFFITARDKEVAHNLLQAYNLKFANRGKGENGLIGKFLYLFKADYLLFRHAKKFNPDLFLSFASPYAAHVSKLLRKPHITFDDTDAWRDVTSSISHAAIDQSQYKLEANITLRLTEGGQLDPFSIRVKITDCNGTVYSNIISYDPDEGSGDHNNWQIVSYLGLFDNDVCTSGNITFTLQVKNTGDDGWEARDRTLLVTRYDL